MSRLARVSASWGAPGTAGAGRPLLLVHDGVAVLVEELLQQVRELLLVLAEAELREGPRGTWDKLHHSTVTTKKGV